MSEPTGKPTGNKAKESLIEYVTCPPIKDAYLDAKSLSEDWTEIYNSITIY